MIETDKSAALVEMILQRCPQLHLDMPMTPLIAGMLQALWPDASDEHQRWMAGRLAIAIDSLKRSRDARWKN